MIWSHVILNKVDSSAQKFHQYKKMSSTVVLLRTVPHIWIYILWLINHSPACQQQDGYIVHDSFFLYLQINISQISIISTILMKFWAQHIKWYVTTCFQIRSRIILFIIFGYIPGLYIFSRMWKLSTYFKEGKV